MKPSLILDVIQKFALSYPDVAFRLVHDGKEVFRSAGNGSLLEVMAIIYGRDLARQCIEVEGQDFDYTVRGLMALPAQTRASLQLYDRLHQPPDDPLLPDSESDFGSL